MMKVPSPHSKHTRLTPILLLILLSILALTAATGGFYAEPVLAAQLNQNLPADSARGSMIPEGESTIGDTVWLDTNADGIQDAGEVGINGVKINLYLDDGDYQFDPALDSYQGSMDTATNGPLDGFYEFNVVGGNTFYWVEIDDSNFAPGGALEGYTLTSGGTIGPSPLGVYLPGIIEDIKTADFGYVGPSEPGSISGTVYDDLNGNGQPDPGEPGIPGVTVELQDDDCTPEVDCPTTVTDALGNYIFEDVEPGDYSIVETDPDGYISTGDADGPTNGDNQIDVTLGSGEVKTDQDFFDQALGSISGVVYDDINGNGVQDPGEPGLPGVEVCLYDATGAEVDCENTAGDGSYMFPDVPPGDYTVSETDPPDYTSTTPNDLPVTVNSGEVVTDVDFGDQQIVPGTGSITGTVCDGDGDGFCDTEPGISGVTVALLDNSGAVVAMTTTDTNGDYSFPNVTPGTYSVVETDLPGWESLNDADGSGNGPNRIDNVVVVADTETPGRDFEDTPLPGSLSGTVYDDLNGNGQYDADEPGIEGVTVELQNGVCTPGDDCPTEVTDINGDYSFPDLAPGSYTVVETDPDGHISTGDVFGVNDNIVVADVGPGEDVVDQDFFDQALGSISGNVWDDVNGNGINDGEDSLPGVTVCLYLDGQQVDCTTTDGDGDYSFPDLPPGDYTVVETDPDDYTSTTPNDIPVTVSPGEDITDVDAGDQILEPDLGSISGTVCEGGGDGQCEQGEPGIAGVTVELLDATGVIATTTTDADGNYSFPNLPPDTYTVNQTNLPGYTSLADADGGDPDSILVTLVDDSDVTDRDFEDQADPGSISGTVWDDLNGNGQQDGDEPGISDVEVCAFNSAGQPTCVTTDEDGIYSFPDLPPDTYTVVETDPEGYVSTGDTWGANDNIVVVDLGPGEDSEDNDYFDQQEPITEPSEGGDAPDSRNHASSTPMNTYSGGALAQFPSVWDPTLPVGPNGHGLQHVYPSGGPTLFLGTPPSLEQDADLLADGDGITNLLPPVNAADQDGFDDGTTLSGAWLNGSPAQLTVNPSGAGFVNVWIDWNRDGDWSDATACGLGSDEWAAQNVPVTPGPNVIPLGIACQPGSNSSDPLSADLWMRVTVTTAPLNPGADPFYSGGGQVTGAFVDGETEDRYVIFAANAVSLLGLKAQTTSPWLLPVLLALLAALASVALYFVHRKKLSNG